MRFSEYSCEHGYRDVHLNLDPCQKCKDLSLKRENEDRFEVLRRCVTRQLGFDRIGLDIMGAKDRIRLEVYLSEKGVEDEKPTEGELRNTFAFLVVVRVGYKKEYVLCPNVLDFADVISRLTPLIKFQEGGK